MCIRDRLKGRESVNVPFIVVAVGWKPATGPLPGVVANEPVPDRVPPVQLKIPVALLLGMTILPVPVSVPLLKFSVGRVVVAAPSRLSVPPVMFSVFAAKVPVSEVAPLLTFSVPVPVTPPLCTSSAPSVLIPVSVVRCHLLAHWPLTKPASNCRHRRYMRLSLIHISEPTRLGMISYAVFCLKKKK